MTLPNSSIGHHTHPVFSTGQSVRPCRLPAVPGSHPAVPLLSLVFKSSGLTHFFSYDYLYFFCLRVGIVPAAAILVPPIVAFCPVL